MCWLAPKAGQEEVNLSSYRVSCDCFSMCLIPRQVEILAPLTPGHREHWIWCALDWGKDLIVGHRGDLVLQWRLDEAVVTIGGAYSRDTSEDSQISDGSCFATAHSLICAESPNGPCLPC